MSISITPSPECWKVKSEMGMNFFKAGRDVQVCSSTYGNLLVFIGPLETSIIIVTVPIIQKSIAHENVKHITV